MYLKHLETVFGYIISTAFTVMIFKIQNGKALNKGYGHSKNKKKKLCYGIKSDCKKRKFNYLN